MTNPPPLRTDLSIIASLVKDSTKVLDVGCGDGTLLEYLTLHKHVDGRGIELYQSGVRQSMRKGMSVIQGDADTDLQFYPDNSFDYVISSQVIQATHHPKEVLAEMMRIGKQAIISLPNFGYWKNRHYLLSKGRMPVTETLSYQWYDTPNIHFCTVKDFIALCGELEYTVEKRTYIGNNGKVLGLGAKRLYANMFAEQGIFLLSKQEF
jgi:methionine biosynthesis protein MetW